MKGINKISGFTLMEILIVIAIIAILAGALFSNFFSAVSRGRDSRRKQDLRSIAAGLELYYNDNRLYPTAMPTPGDSFTHPSDINTIYMQEVPGDPMVGKNYCYDSTDGSWFKLYANLENRSDPDLLATPGTCNSEEYNYGISSPNVLP